MPLRPQLVWVRPGSLSLSLSLLLLLTVLQESDYLHLIYHLYDSEGSDSEAED